VAVKVNTGVGVRVEVDVIDAVGVGGFRSGANCLAMSPKQ
jgi:hypothetical protein